jgi:ferredoxin like protein
MKIEDRLSLVKHAPDKDSHLEIVSTDRCLKCSSRPCLYFCPAGVYRWDENANKVNVAYEGCFECGACRIACPHENISWRWPRGGCGVAYRFG